MFTGRLILSPVCVQVIGKVPTISINKTDGCHVYLSQDSLNCEIISAKSSEMNILVPNKDGEFVSILPGGAWLKGRVCSGSVLELIRPHHITLLSFSC